MAVEFRCEKCGKLLTVEAEPGAKVRCQYCNAKVAVPAGLASLPRPQVPTGAAPPPSPPPGAPPAAEAQGEEAYRQDAMMDTMAKLMPWVISLFFHAGIVIILTFLTIFSYSTKVAEGVPIPDAKLTKNPGAKLNPVRSRSKLRTKSTARTVHNWAKRNDTLNTDRGQTKDAVPLHGLDEGAGGSPGDFLLRSGAGGPRPSFIGVPGGNSYHIVLVVDRSGSMLDYFDYVRTEMKKTITKLLPVQTFHVVLFARGMGPKDENPSRRLVRATKRNKKETLEFLAGVTCEGGMPTNPLAALKRAFEVLASPPNKKPGKVIYLLTDGEFHNNEEVRRKIRQWNKKGDVLVNTILYAGRGEDIRKTLEQIAIENGGRFECKGRSE